MKMRRKILIIPDVHGRTFWKEPLKEIDTFEKIIFLGDYLDPYDYFESITPEMALENFKEILEVKKANPHKIILLLGNHCSHYAWPGDAEKSTRYSYELAPIIEPLYKETEFLVAYQENIGDTKYIFTHAGITKRWIEQNKLELPEDHIDCWLNSLAHEAMGRGMIADIGRSRGGYAPSGGPMWADFYEDHDPYFANFEGRRLRKDIYQIFGHTQTFNGNVGKNIACLDCKKAWVMDLETGEIERYEKDNRED